MATLASVCVDKTSDPNKWRSIDQTHLISFLEVSVGE